VTVACLVLTACSPGADYPSLFPAVHDIPPPRADTPLDANQVQQATEDLITARDRLNTEAQGAQSKTASDATTSTAASAKSQPKSSANSQLKSAAKTATGLAAAQKPIRQVSGRDAPGSDAAPPADAQAK
jgi:hypothetical protein